MLETVASWILTYALHSAAFCVLAFVMSVTLRSHPSIRCMLWRAALFAPLFTSAATASGALGQSRNTIAVAEPARPYLNGQWARQEVLMDVIQVSGRDPVHTVRTVDRLSTVTSIVVVTVAAFVGIAGIVMIRRRRRMALRRLSEDTKAVHGLTSAFTRAINVSACGALAVPLALTGRRICLPQRALTDLSTIERDSVLLHEIAHIERSDPQWIDASRLLCAMTAWQPLNRRVLDALERDSELAADAHAIRIGAEPAALVSALAYFASRLGNEPAIAGVSLVRNDSPLVVRARRMLDSAGDAPSRTSFAAATAGFALGVALVLALPAAIPARVAEPGTGLKPVDTNERSVEVREIDVRKGQQPR